MQPYWLFALSILLPSDAFLSPRLNTVSTIQNNFFVDDRQQYWSSKYNNIKKQHKERYTSKIGHRQQSSQLLLSPVDHLDIFTSISVAAKQLNIEEIRQSTINGLGHDILTFLLVTVVTLPLSRSLNVNPILSFLAAGCVLGPHGLQIFSNNEADLQLGDFGILFLLFNEGLSLSFERIDRLKQFGNLGVIQIMISMAAFFFGTLLIGPFALQYLEPVIPLDDGLLRPILSNPVQAFCIASAGALSSSAFVLPVLKEKNWEDRQEGIAGLSILLLQDLAVAPLLVILPVLSGSGPQTAPEFGILIAKAVFGFGGVLIAGRYILSYVFELVATARSTETFVAAALLVVIGMGQIADLLGLSASTGAFAAGVLLAGNKFRPQIQADIKPFEGILLGIFFLTAGAELDPVTVLQEWPTLLTGIIAFIITKAAVLFASGPALGLNKGESARVALTLAGGGEFSFVLFTLAKELNVLPDALIKLLTASVILSMTLTPILGDIGDAAGNFLEQYEEESAIKNMNVMSTEEALKLFSDTDIDDSGEISLEELRTALVKLNVPYATIAEIFALFDTNNDNVISEEEWLTGVEAGLWDKALRLAVAPNDIVVKSKESDSFLVDSYVICGFGNVGKSVYTLLEGTGANKDGSVVAFSLDTTRISEGNEEGIPVIFGDGARYDLYKAVGVKTPRAVLVTYASLKRRSDAVKRLRGTLPPGTSIFVYASGSRESEELMDAGATEIFCDNTEAVLRCGDILGLISSENQKELLRKKLLKPMSQNAGADKNIFPGYSKEDVTFLAEEVNASFEDIVELYRTFDSFDRIDGGDVAVAEVKDFVLRNSAIGPVDAAELMDRLAIIDEDGEGKITFEEFVEINTCYNEVFCGFECVPEGDEITGDIK